MQTLSMRLRQAAEMLAAVLFAGTLQGCKPTRPAVSTQGECSGPDDCVRAHGAGWYCDPGPPTFCRPPAGPLAGPEPALPTVYGPPPGPPAYGPPIVPLPTAHYGPRPIQYRPPPNPASNLYGPQILDYLV